METVSLAFTCLNLQFRHPFRVFRWNRILFGVIGGAWTEPIGLIKSWKRCAFSYDMTGTDTSNAHNVRRS